MECKDFLQRYETALTRIDILKQKLEVLDDRSRSPSSPTIDGLPHGSGFRNPTDNYAVRIEELLDQIEQAEAEAEAIFKEIESAIEKMPGTTAALVRQKEILKLRYIDLLKWGDISRVLFGSKDDYTAREESYIRRTTKTHSKALATFTEYMKGGQGDALRRKKD